MKVLAIIPARGGSKGIPRKNLRELAGKPLIVWTIEAALAAGSLDRVVVSTDDEEIAEVSRLAGVDVLMRPEELAADDTPTLPVLQDVVARLEREEGYRPDAVMTLQPTSPLRQARHIDEAIALFNADANADSLVSVMEVPHHFHPLSVMKKAKSGYLENFIEQEQAVTRRQDKVPVFARNGAAVYITRIGRLKDFVFGGKLLAYPMDADESLDIDEPADLERAEKLLGERGVA